MRQSLRSGQWAGDYIGKCGNTGGLKSLIGPWRLKLVRCLKPTLSRDSALAHFYLVCDP